jgi:hypothetical protein
VNGEGYVAYRQVGPVLSVALARLESDTPVLLRIESAEDMPMAPQIVEIALNDGSIPTIVARPVEFALAQNVPNPFNPQTTIRFSVPEGSPVRLAVFDVTGRLVRTLVDGDMAAGRHSIIWDGRDAVGRDVASGVFVCRLASAQGSLVRRMVLLR